MGKSKQTGGPTRANERFRKLIGELGQIYGWSQSDIARLLNVDPSYINKIKGGTRATDLGADIILRVKKELRIDPNYFFDEKEPESFRLYLLDEKRLERRLDQMAETQELIRRQLAELQQRVQLAEVPKPSEAKVSKLPTKRHQ